jgi:alpha 1,2-mannosyltransferase
VFYEESDVDFDLGRVRAFSNSKLFFQTVRFDVPSFLNKSAIPQHGCLGRFSISYRHMCRFHSKLVYEQPIMSALDYALRLDDDSLILRPISYDIFRYARDNGIKYGYVVDGFEAACVDGLWPAVDRYIEREGIRPQFYFNRSIFSIFYNNFELSSMELWRSQAYQKYIDYIDRLGGIYFSRWGDAPIKTIAVSLFLPLAETHYFSDVLYQHQGVKTLGISS